MNATTNKQLKYIQKRKKHNLNRLRNKEIDANGYKRALQSYKKQAHNLKQKRIYPNTYLEILKLEEEITNELQKLIYHFENAKTDIVVKNDKLYLK